MIINPLEVPTNDLQTDICIIGSGLGGGSLAYKLSKKRIPFIVVEAGGESAEKDLVTYENAGRSFKLNATSSIELGGTSNLWHGVLSPMDPIDFEKREWIPESGWPISLQELDPFYREACAFLGVKAYDYFQTPKIPEPWQSQLTHIKYNSALLKNKIFQQPIPPKRLKKTLKDICQKSDSHHLLLHTVALELKGSKDTAHVEELIAQTSHKKTVKIKAKKFVICCGAIESPRLLLNSKSQQTEGLGNQKDLVGRYLMDHPMGNLFQIGFKKRTEAGIYSDTKYAPQNKIKTGLIFQDEVQKKYRFPNHNFFIRPSFAKGIHDETERIKLALLTLRESKFSFHDIKEVLFHPNIVYQILAYKMTLKVKFRYGDLFFLTEQLPNPQSRITLSKEAKDIFGYPKARVDWQLLSDDIDNMLKIYDLLSQEAFPSEHYSMTHKREDIRWDDILTSAAHHCGTLRMGDSENKSVTDKNLRIFSTQNVYVCDSSVFPTSGNVNAGLTISALAFRLAQHLSF